MHLQGATIGRHEQALNKVGMQLGDITQMLTHLSVQVARLASSASPPADPPNAIATVAVSPAGAAVETPMSPPEKFSGDSRKCQGFLLQCSVFFEQQPGRFPSERSRVAYMLSLLSGRALDWATPLWERGAEEVGTVSRFSQAIRRTFYHPQGGKSAGARLLTLNQGTRSAVEYSIDFQTLAADCRWVEEAFREIFYKGLSERVNDELATRDLPDSLEALYDLASRVDGRLRERTRERGEPPKHSRSRDLQEMEEGGTPLPEPEPVEIGLTRRWRPIIFLSACLSQRPFG